MQRWDRLLEQYVDRLVARGVSVVVRLFYGCGLRTDELCSLDLADLDCERHELLVHFTPGAASAIPLILHPSQPAQTRYATSVHYRPWDVCGARPP